jgi:hypothetical protein
VPASAVTVATALVGNCLFALLFHVHKVAHSIIADTPTMPNRRLTDRGSSRS